MNNSYEPNKFGLYIAGEQWTVNSWQRIRLPKDTTFLSDTVYGFGEHRFLSFSIYGACSQKYNIEISNPGASGAFSFIHGSLLPKLKITEAKC